MPTPSKFTADTRQTILEVKRVGGPDTLACAAARITVTTLNRWLDKGKTAEEGRYREFFEEYQEAKAHPKVRALGMVYKRVADNDQMLWKYVERQVDGFAPPMPNVHQAPTGPVVIQLSLSDGRPALPSTVIEVADVEDLEPGTAPANPA
jgi:hypothetical protein